MRNVGRKVVVSSSRSPYWRGNSQRLKTLGNRRAMMFTIRPGGQSASMLATPEGGHFTSWSSDGHLLPAVGRNGTRTALQTFEGEGYGRPV